MLKVNGFTCFDCAIYVVCTLFFRVAMFKKGTNFALRMTIYSMTVSPYTHLPPTHCWMLGSRFICSNASCAIVVPHDPDNRF